MTELSHLNYTILEISAEPTPDYAEVIYQDDTIYWFFNDNFVYITLAFEPCFIKKFIISNFFLLKF